MRIIKKILSQNLIIQIKKDGAAKFVDSYMNRKFYLIIIFVLSANMVQ